MSSFWNKNISASGVNLNITTSLTKVQFPEVADVNLSIDLISPGSAAPDDCGYHGQGPSGTHDIVVRDDGSGACNEAMAAAHEFGHHVGFADAYVQPSPPALRSGRRHVVGEPSAALSRPYPLGEVLMRVSPKRAAAIAFILPLSSLAGAQTARRLPG